MMTNILIAGDFCAKERVAPLLDEGRYNDVFEDVLPIIRSSDYSIVNLEAPIIDKKIKTIDKLGPSHFNRTSVVQALNNIGFRCATLANNHFYDYGEEGVHSTLRYLREGHIDYVGAGNNIFEASKTLFKNICGRTFAFINCCEHEFSIATENSSGSNPLDLVQQYYAIRQAKSKADYVIVIVHGGIEQYQLPTPRMVDSYRFFVDVGADAVVNHHQHCYSGYEFYKNKPIVYGLGNFCFDSVNNNQKWGGIWNEGYMISLLFENDKIQIKPIPYKQCYSSPKVLLMNNSDKIAFNQNLQKLNAIIVDRKSLVNEYESFMERTSSLYNFFHPYTNIFLLKLYRRGFLPSLFGKKKYLNLLNKIECESHRERLIFYIKKRLKLFS